MIYSIYSKVTIRLFAIDNLWFPSHPPRNASSYVLHPSLTCRNERHKILEHEPNISLPLLAFLPLSIEKIKIDMQNRSNVHFHAFFILYREVEGRRRWIE